MPEATQLSLTLLDELGLRAFLKTSGGKGMHLLVPLERRHGWDEVKDFAQAISQHLARLMPERFSAVSAAQTGSARSFVDYLRNSRGASTVAAYSVARPRRVAGVGTGVPRGTRLAAGRQPMEPAQSAAAPRRTRRRRSLADYAGTRQRISAASRGASSGAADRPRKRRNSRAHRASTVQRDAEEAPDGYRLPDPRAAGPVAPGGCLGHQQRVRSEAAPPVASSAGRC